MPIFVVVLLHPSMGNGFSIDSAFASLEAANDRAREVGLDSCVVNATTLHKR